MAESKEVQRFERMKVYANKLMDKLANQSDHPKAKLWDGKLQQTLLNMQVMEHEAAAAVVKEKHKAGGVRIEVPTKHFSTKMNVPETAPAN